MEEGPPEFTCWLCSMDFLRKNGYRYNFRRIGMTEYVMSAIAHLRQENKKLIKEAYHDESQSSLQSQGFVLGVACIQVLGYMNVLSELPLQLREQRTMWVSQIGCDASSLVKFRIKHMLPLLVPRALSHLI